MSWDTVGTGANWNDGVANATFDDQPAANSVQASGEVSHGQANEYEGNEEPGSGGFGGAMNDGVCFNCGEQGYATLPF